MNQKVKWSILAAVACVFWGISGLFGKNLFNSNPLITPIFLTKIRMVISGIIILLFATITNQKPFTIWKNKKDAITVSAYGLFGLVPVQLFYFMVVKEANASIATVLQFVGPFFVIFWMLITKQQVYRNLDLISATLAFLGVFLLATHGNLQTLTLSPGALFFGILSAVGVATNTLIPRRIITSYPTVVITGWGLLIAGIALFVFDPSVPKISITWGMIIDLAGVIVIGTLIPFQWMAVALRYISPSTASLLDAFEPISAMIGSVILFNLILSPMDIIGSVMIIGAVLLVSLNPPRLTKKAHR